MKIENVIFFVTPDFLSLSKPSNFRKIAKHKRHTIHINLYTILDSATEINNIFQRGIGTIWQV